MAEWHRNLLYCTPEHLTLALLKRESFSGQGWEPAAGRGHIARVLKYCTQQPVWESDLRNWGHKLDWEEDFLESDHVADWIVTNPPWEIGLTIMDHCKNKARKKFALLLNASNRYAVGFLRTHFSDLDYPFKRLIVFPQSVKWLNIKEVYGRLTTAWFVFDRDHKGPHTEDVVYFS